MNTTLEETLFKAAVQLEPEKRPAFLQAKCGSDPAVRKRLEALLAAHDASPEFMSKTSTDCEIKVELAREDMVVEGQKIGRYKILEKVGEGGCGVVYVAEQLEPIRRRVALKVIKLGMDTKQVVARFEAERQALAMMDHPNIAKVLDAGATEQGRPYFVMELVRGIRITDYCDQNNLTTNDRLHLFITVCQAVQHAHQKGIIHRDIKPSNILVTLHDGVPVPKVIDFGIAKATEGRLTDATIYTQLHQFVGTPAYMSPEQAEMSGLDIDTRSDIYSLGVLLYELLTGRTPFDAKELMAAGVDAMRRTIREVDPARPSTRLAALKGMELTTTAKRRSVEGSKLLHQVKGDVDWIAMKCLEKDRTRRYETANGLAADLKRHLDCEPVVARPPNAGYRFRKAVKRNKLAFAAGAAVVIGLFVVSALLLRERAAFGAMRLAEQKSAEERIYFAILSGDEKNTGRALQEAENKGVSAARLHYFRGLHLLTTMQARQAVSELTAAHAMEPGNVATLGLLATASFVGKGAGTYESFIRQLKEARPVTPEDFLFLGQALNIFDHREGVAFMERAIAEKDSPMARLIVAGAKTEAARQTGSIALVEAALSDVAAARSWGGQSLPVLMAAIEAHFVSATLHTKSGDSQRARADAEIVEQLSERLESFHPNVQALRARLAHLVLSGQTEKALKRAQLWAGELPGLNFQLYASWVLLKEEKFDLILELPRPKTDPLLLLVRLLARLELPGTENEGEELLRYLSERPIRGINDLFCAVSANQLFGRAEKAEQIGRAFYDRQSFSLQDIPSAYQATVKYLSGASQEAEALNADSAVTSVCSVRHFIALRHLGKGDRVKARENFQASRDSGAEGEIGQILSEYMFNRLVKTPNWPHTISAVSR